VKVAERGRLDLGKYVTRIDVIVRQTLLKCYHAMALHHTWIQHATHFKKLLFSH
jgi:hypothetical protein